MAGQAADHRACRRTGSKFAENYAGYLQNFYKNSRPRSIETRSISAEAADRSWFFHTPKHRRETDTLLFLFQKKLF